MNKKQPDFMQSPAEYFGEVLQEAFESRQIKTFPLVHQYLIDMLTYYMFTDNLFDIDKETGQRKSPFLAELYLTAHQKDLTGEERVDLYKKLGDTSLYISGFFGDSLKRKVVDVDYYAGIGGAAYGCLAEQAEESLYAKLYEEFAHRFLEFVDVLTFISQKVLIQTNKDLLRLYDRYISTGSELAREQLIENGLLANPLKKSYQ